MSDSAGSSPHQPCSLESREWQRFWRIAFFGTILPFLLLLGALEWLGWSLGETYTPDALIHALDEHPDMAWSLTNGHVCAELKLAQVARLKPDVLIIGQSRVSRMRADMFGPYTFYNLSRVSFPFGSYPELLRRLPDGYRPKLILFNMDFFMFSPGYAQRWGSEGPVYGHWIHENLIEVHHVVTQVLQHPSLLWRRRTPAGLPANGCSAILGGDAFFKDGSTRMPDQEIRFARLRPDYYPQHTDMAQYITGGSKMSPAEMADLKEFVDLAREKGIPIVAVQMPMYGPALRALEKNPNYGLLQDFRDHVANGYIDRLGLLFFNYLSMPPYSEDYHYFDDGVHPTWTLTALVVNAMASDPRFHSLLPRLDLEALARQAKMDPDADRRAAINE